MPSNSLIEEKLFGYENFLMYCRESGKKFVEELDNEDFIAYRVEYSVTREEIEQLKSMLDFSENNSAEKIYCYKEPSIEIEDSLQSYFGIDNLAPYENILITDFWVKILPINYWQR